MVELTFVVRFQTDHFFEESGDVLEGQGTGFVWVRQGLRLGAGGSNFREAR